MITCFSNPAMSSSVTEFRGHLIRATFFSKYDRLDFVECVKCNFIICHLRIKINGFFNPPIPTMIKDDEGTYDILYITVKAALKALVKENPLKLHSCVVSDEAYRLQKLLR